MKTIAKLTSIATLMLIAGMFVQGAPKDNVPSKCIWEDSPVSAQCMEYGQTCIYEDGMDGVADCWWLDRSNGNVWFVRK